MGWLQDCKAAETRGGVGSCSDLYIPATVLVLFFMLPPSWLGLAWHIPFWPGTRGVLPPCLLCHCLYVLSN